MSAKAPTPPPREPRSPEPIIPPDPEKKVVDCTRFTPDQAQSRRLLAALLKGRGWTYSRIAAVLGVSRERARQLVGGGTFPDPEDDHAHEELGEVTK